MKKYDSFEDDDYDYKKPSLLDKIGKYNKRGEEMSDIKKNMDDYFKEKQEERINKIIEDREREQEYKREKEEVSRQNKEYTKRENQRRNIRDAIREYEKDKWRNALMGVPYPDNLLKHKWFKRFDWDLLKEEGVY